MHALTTHSRAPLVVIGLLASLVAFAVLLASLQWGSVGVVVSLGLVPATSAAVADLRAGRLPNRSVVATFVPAAILTVQQSLSGYALDAVPAVAAGAALFAGPLFILHVARPDAMGFGDVKLAAALGASLGLVEPRASLIALCVASVVTATIGLATRRPTMPLGPGLVAGAATSLAFASILGATPLPWR